jgi:cytochrome c biogenesis protein CcmG, thiol:disulfide interchange protein DsbE
VTQAAPPPAAQRLSYADRMTATRRWPSPSSPRWLVPALLIALVACGGTRVTDEAARFQLPTLEGERLGPPDFPDKAVVVDFWATWCAPCHVQAEILEQLYAEYQGRPVQFLAVNTGEREDVVREWVASKPFPYPVLLDPDERLSEELGIMGLPTIMVVSRQGEVLYMAPGIVPANRLRSLLAEAGA